ncbi:conserved oligomeric Golgi complex subunit 8-like [Macrosteles quadrilineatus]|uniref:conserved oligomeric Golgi complex subunit 8-like n=1 Tax=Macrosteles quadrilineatus TaxID=74068 RepID=UPI0023E23DA7|nr:conserved oligomeric Golgi complex subunit 8-like [Macrosteles quadrilineatus]
MDAEIKNITKLIFPEGVPESWKINPDFYAYLTKLGGYTVEQLSKEPDRLAEEKCAVLSQTQELAFSNYKTFIRTAECSREIFQQFNNAETSLNSLVERVPGLTSRCEEFAKASSEIKTARRLNSLTLTRNAQLLQVLEIPQLMETCIREGYYEEALQLAAYVKRLGAKHGDIPIVASIVREVDAAWWALLNQLIAALRTDLQLPRCLQVVGYLRRMQTFSEAELRLKFLSVRDSWLQSELAKIPNDDAAHHLTKTIELSRIHLFNIVTQYRAVFSDEEPVLSSRQLSLAESTIFHSWLNEKVSQFITTLEHDLSRGVGSSLASLLGQCMYFGLSFSRVGADFRALVAPIFVKTVQQNFETAVRKATKKFEADMDKFTLPKNQTQNKSVLPSLKINASTKQEQPPECLLEFYPLAEYCNNLLTGLNNLRLCAPLACVDNVTNQLQESLTSAARTVLSFYRQEQQALSKPEKESFSRFCMCFGDQLVPFMQRCIHAVYKPSEVAQHLGLSTYQLQQQELSYLDQNAIVDAIAHLLPDRIQSSLPTSPPAPILTEKQDQEQDVKVDTDCEDKSENIENVSVVE